MLQKAIEIAEQALAGMTDQNGQPYIEHARRVMDAMDTEEEKIVAILHDVIRVNKMSFKTYSLEKRKERSIEALTRNNN